MPTQLETEIAQAKSDLLHIKAEFKRYNLALQSVRQEQDERMEHLDAWEQNLRGRERALTQNLADFEHRQKQFKQLRGLSR